MRTQVQTDLSLDHPVDQQAQHRPHRSRRNPFGLLQPHGSDRRGVLDPTKTRFSCRVLLLISLENLGIAAYLSAYGRGPYGPPIVLLGIGQGGNLHHQAIARLEDGGSSFAGRPRRARRMRRVSATMREQTA